MSRVILIEEDSMLRSTLTRIMVNRSYSVRAAWSTPEALEALVHVLRPGDVIVVDIERASKTPEYILNWLGRYVKDTPILILSTWAPCAEHIKPHWRVLLKPFGVSLLLESLEELQKVRADVSIH